MECDWDKWSVALLGDGEDHVCVECRGPIGENDKHWFNQRCGVIVERCLSCGDPNAAGERCDPLATIGRVLEYDRRLVIHSVQVCGSAVFAIANANGTHCETVVIDEERLRKLDQTQLLVALGVEARKAFDRHEQQASRWDDGLMLPMEVVPGVMLEKKHRPSFPRYWRFWLSATDTGTSAWRDVSDGELNAMSRDEFRAWLKTEAEKLAPKQAEPARWVRREPGRTGDVVTLIERPPSPGIWVWEGEAEYSPGGEYPGDCEPQYDGEWRRADPHELAQLARGEMPPMREFPARPWWMGMEGPESWEEADDVE